MGKPTGQLPDRFHFLRLNQGLFGNTQGLDAVLFVGQVLAQRKNDSIAGCSGPAEPVIAAVDMLVTIFKQRQYVVGGVFQGVLGVADIIRMQQGHDRGAEQLVFRVAQQRCPGRVYPQEDTVEIEDRQRVRRYLPKRVQLQRSLFKSGGLLSFQTHQVIDQFQAFALAFLQRLLIEDVRGGFVGDAEHADHYAVLVDHR